MEDSKEPSSALMEEWSSTVQLDSQEVEWLVEEDQETTTRVQTTDPPPDPFLSREASQSSEWLAHKVQLNGDEEWQPDFQELLNEGNSVRPTAEVLPEQCAAGRALASAKGDDGSTLHQFGCSLDHVPVSSLSSEGSLLVLKRCGVPNEELASSRRSFSVCSRHRGELTSQFSEGGSCQLCGCAVEKKSAKVISASLQDVLHKFYSNFLMGRLLCLRCFARVGRVLGRRLSKTPAGFAKLLMNTGIVHDISPLVGKDDDVEEIHPGRVWVSLDDSSLIKTSTSEVPPFR